MSQPNIYNPKTGATGYQVPGAAIPAGWVAGAAPTPPPATLVKDPSTGMFSANAGTTDSGMVPVSGGSSLGGLSPKQDPYTVLNQNIASILTQLSIKAPQIKNNLSAAKDAITNVAAASATPYNPQASTASNNQNLTGTFQSFAPAEADVNSQLQNFTSGISDLGTTAAGLETAYQPQVLGAGQSLVTRDGTVLQRAPSYLPPQIRPDTGVLDSFDQANGVWRSDVMNGSTGGKTSVVSNNNPLNIKLTATTTKMFEALGASIGSAATDGGNFVHFNTPADGIKAARMLLQSPLYANDSVDQALKAWSNNGYNSSIVAGTGINPHALIKDLDPVQLDTLMNAMQKAEGGAQNQTSTLAPNVQADAQELANGKLAPQVLSDRYTNAYGKDGGTLYNLAVQAAKKINPAFDETKANLAFEGQKEQTINQNSGNPITSIFSNIKNAITTPATTGLLSPAKASASTGPTTYKGFVLPYPN